MLPTGNHACVLICLHRDVKLTAFGVVTSVSVAACVVTAVSVSLSCAMASDTTENTNRYKINVQDKYPRTLIKIEYRVDPL